MEKYQILLGFLVKQKGTINKFTNEVKDLDLDKYENLYVFALKTQQLYTAIEDVFVRIAKTFENPIQELQKYHSELLKRMNIEVQNHRPAVISDKTYVFLNKIRAFRHFVRHAYDYELDKEELSLLQKKINEHSAELNKDLDLFQQFLVELTSEK
jgi:hypothetical protein